MAEHRSHTKMSARTLEALRASIAKWEARAAGTDAMVASSQGCPLCMLFNTDEMTEDENCTGCPIYELNVGHRWCEGTPYEDYRDAYWKRDGEARVAAAQREVAFLKSLLPTDAPSDETVTGENHGS